tara:strand:- start:791 stop:1054 length:264 start_codon:yes stop_codon:yes gene_type:complete
MVHVFLSYFTEEVIRDIRASQLYVTTDSWARYRAYHSTYEKVSSENAVFLFNEFRNKCETIATLPKACLMPGNLARIFRIEHVQTDA